MTCAACQARVQRTLLKAPGLVEASVNLMMANATVSFDVAATSADALVARIRETGYGAELPPTQQSAFEEQIARDSAQQQEFEELRTKAWASGIVSEFANDRQHALDGRNGPFASRSGCRPVHSLGDGAVDPDTSNNGALALHDFAGSASVDAIRAHAWHNGVYYEAVVFISAATACVRRS